MHQWGKYANIYVRCEIPAINNVDRNAVHRHQMRLIPEKDTTAQLHRQSWQLRQRSQKTPFQPPKAGSHLVCAPESPSLPATVYNRALSGSHNLPKGFVLRK